MSPPIKAIPVGEILRKADPVKAPRLTVIRCLRSYENDDVNWAADQVVKQLKGSVTDLEVADLYLSSYRVVTGASNDPDNDRFDPEDQFPAVLEPIKSANIIVVAFCESCGLPHSNVVRLIERLFDLHTDPERTSKHPLLAGKSAGVVALGGNACHAASTVMVALNQLGCALPSVAVACWTNSTSKPFKSDDFAATLTSLAKTLAG